MGKKLKKNFETVGRPNMTGVTVVKPDAAGGFGTTGGQFFQDKPKVSKPALEATGKAQILIKYFEDVSHKELTSKFGKIDLVVDFYGALSYLSNPQLIGDKLAQAMKPGAKLSQRDGCTITLRRALGG